MLAREFLRRAALAAQALNATADWPWFDPAARAALPGVPRTLPGYVLLGSGKDYPGPEADPLEARVLAWNGCLNANPPNHSGHVRQICLRYIRWAAVKRHPALAGLALADPFEPLIRMYERGDTFRTEHGVIDFGETMLAIGFRHALDLAPLPALTSAILDGFD